MSNPLYIFLYKNFLIDTYSRWYWSSSHNQGESIKTSKRQYQNLYRLPTTGHVKHIQQCIILELLTQTHSITESIKDFDWVSLRIPAKECILGLFTTPPMNKSYHSVFSAGLLRTAATILAPWLGGLDQVFLTISSVCDLMAFICELSELITTKLPTLSSANKF